MPTFCRHNRFAESCPICSKAPRTRPGTVSDREATRRTPREPAARSAAPAAKRRRAPRPGDVVVRRMARAVDDGYANALVPGLRGSDDARRLADELAFSAARLEALASEPTGLYAEAALAADREEGLWLAFLIAYLGPIEGAPDPFAEIARVRVPWGTGELPDLEGVLVGPRGAHEPKRGDAVVAAYRARAGKAGGQAALLAGDATPQRRFDRGLERLQMAGFGRSPRYEFLVLCSRLGLADVDPWSLALASADALDPVLVAAKRVFGIGDTLNLHRRGHDLAAAVGVPVAALDLALYNWGLPAGAERVTTGVQAVPDAGTRDRIADVLGVDDGADVADPDIAEN